MSEEILKIKQRYEEYLKGIKGVTGVGLNGSIIVYVDRVTPEIRQVIPRQLEGVPVHIVESKFRLMALRIMDATYADRVMRYRPAPGGVSVGHPSITAGTLACRVLDKVSGEVIGGLSNNHVCFDKETEVLTEDGWKSFEELNTSDFVATLNSNGEMEYQRPIAIQKLEYNGLMIRFKSQFFDLLVTPEHRLYVWHKKYDGKYRDSRHGKYLGENHYDFMSAYDVYSRVINSAFHSNIGFTKKATWNCIAVEDFKIPEVIYQGKDFNLRESVDISLWMRFLGWYLSEGSYCNTYGRYIVSIRNTDNKNLMEIADVIDRLGFNPQVSTKTGYVQVNSKQLYNYVKQFGHCRDKFVPKEFKQLPPEMLWELFDAYVKGDGHRTSRSEDIEQQFIVTASKRMADDLQEIAIKMGATASIKKFVSKGIWSTGNEYYLVSVHWKWLEPEIYSAHVSIEEYNGKVYDCTVPNGIILVRRKGFPLWSGNCALDWGEVHEGKVGDSTLQPGPYDGGIDPTDKIGELLKYIPVKLGEDNLVDAAVFDSDELKREVFEVGNPSHTVEPRVGMKVLKSGRTSGVTYGTILDVNATLKIDGGEGWGECTFKNQIVISPAILSPGDSGSWIGEVDTFNTVGLGFAGSDTLSVANPALTVEELLGVEIIPPTPPVKLSYMGLGWAGIFGVGILGMRGVKA